VRHYGERITNEAPNNSLPLRVFDIGRDLLLSKLEDSDFLRVMVDDRLKLRRDFAEEPKGGQPSMERAGTRCCPGRNDPAGQDVLPPRTGPATSDLGRS